HAILIIRDDRTGQGCEWQGADNVRCGNGVCDTRGVGRCRRRGVSGIGSVDRVGDGQYRLARTERHERAAPIRAWGNLQRVSGSIEDIAKIQGDGEHAVADAGRGIGPDTGGIAIGFSIVKSEAEIVTTIGSAAVIVEIAGIKESHALGASMLEANKRY